MRNPSSSAVNREAQPEPVPFRVRSAASAHNRKGPAKRSFCVVYPREFSCRDETLHGYIDSDKPIADFFACPQHTPCTSPSAWPNGWQGLTEWRLR